MESYKVIWNNTEVGQLNNPVPDMWYLEGDWQSNQTMASDEFEKSIMSLDATQVFNDLTKGLKLVLRNGAIAHDLNVIAISLNKGKLFVRLVAKPITHTH